MKYTYKPSLIPKGYSTIWRTYVAPFFASLSFLLLTSPIAVHADANAKEASNYILTNWIAPIFGVIVVYLVIKEFISAKWIQGFAILFFGGIIYAFIKDPEGILMTLAGLKSYFDL
ncbi:TcpD family membrane protein [Enterococcus durans]|uniref:TcpD family membrane protein n=1 Tax=Enterococcus durans TaxID=53345 RepID=UPI001D0B200C|nr:TcpD family membrane protein [Enterococcus durans]MCB8504599.1 hypothetical protein [Enterococcus durans]MCB8514377.1 hypothetical protein [Enterococcus durans]